MSYSFDANILLYAGNQASVHHKKAKNFVISCAEDSELIILTYPTLMAYLRISTHPRIFPSPLSPEEALSDLERLVRLPQLRLVSEEEGFLELYRQVSGELPVRGNLVPDAHLATLLLQHGVKRLFTADSDFRKFAFLKVKNPLS